MMTALNIEAYGGGMLRFLRRNRIRVEHRFCDDAALKCVTYEHHRSKINWTSIDRFVKAQRNRVLCSKDLPLPADCGYKRFLPKQLRRRMCENAALFLLREADCRGVKVVLVDADGDSVGLCDYLTEYCDPLYVVSPMTEIYAAQAEYLLNEKGAALRICRAWDCLRDADLIIVPTVLTDTLPCRSTALILAGEQPAAAQNCTAVWEYFFDLPIKYREMCPSFLDEMYFAGALFEMAGVRELGSGIFTRCGDGSVLHTRMSLVQLFKNHVLSRTNS